MLKLITYFQHVRNQERANTTTMGTNIVYVCSMHVRLRKAKYKKLKDANNYTTLLRDKCNFEEHIKLYQCVISGEQWCIKIGIKFLTFYT